MNGEKAGYWEVISAKWLSSGTKMSWRTYCDALNSRLIDHWLPKSRIGRILKTDLFEEAVGTGVFPLLAARADEVMGIDLSGVTVKTAHDKNHRLGAAAADVRSLPFSDSGFDAVISLSTLDHFKSADGILEGISELARILKPGGKLILTMDNPANPVVWLRNALPIRWLIRLRAVPYYVGATMGRARLEAVLAERSFRVVESATLMHCPRMPAVLAASLVDSAGSGSAAQRVRRSFFQILEVFERLERWPTRYATGYYVAIFAEKNPAGAQSEES